MRKIKIIFKQMLVTKLRSTICNKKIIRLGLKSRHFVSSSVKNHCLKERRVTLDLSLIFVK